MASRKKQQGWRVTADVARFDEAIAYWRSLNVVTEEQFEAMEERARSRAWTIAGVGQLNVLRDVFSALDQAIAKGETLEEFRKRIPGVLSRKQAELAFRNGVQKAYNAGRWEQLKDPEVRLVRPYLMFDAILDSRTSPICNSRNRTIKPADDPYWITNNPPLHHRCRSSLRSLTEAQAKRHGGVTEDTHYQPAAGKGFGLAPDVEIPWEPNPSGYPADIWQGWISKERAWGNAEWPQWGTGIRKPGAPVPWHMDGMKRAGSVTDPQNDLSPNEARIASDLARGGNTVVRVVVPKSPRVQGAKGGHSADVLVNGKPVEFKTLSPAKNQAVRIVRSVAEGLSQARSVIVDTRTSGGTRAHAVEAAKRLAGLVRDKVHPYTRLDYVRVIGDDFDLTWTF